MIKFHAITNAFSHTHGSCLSIPPKNKWIYELPLIIDGSAPTVFVDHHLIFGRSIPYREKSKFGWLCESSAIIPDIIQFVKTHHETLKNNYIKIFTNDESLISLSSLFDYCPAGSNMPWVTDWKIAHKNKLISLIASEKRITRGHIFRHKLAEQYKDKIDLFGRQYKHIETKDEALKPYMFSFCIENDQYDLYYTEKLTDAIACGTVPIYWGSEKIKTIFNPDGFVFLDNNFDITKVTKELYQEKVNAINENFQILKSLKSSDDIVQEKIKEIIDGK